MTHRGAPKSSTVMGGLNANGVADNKPWVRGRTRPVLGWAMLVVGLCLVLSTAWVCMRVYQAYTSLQAAAQSITGLEGEAIKPDGDTAGPLADLQVASASARSAVSDPMFQLAAGLPWVGPNLDAVASIAETVDALAVDVLPQLVGMSHSLNLRTFALSNSTIDLLPLIKIAPTMRAVNAAVHSGVAQIAAVDRDSLVEPVDRAVAQLAAKLGGLQALTETGAQVTTLMPPMMGSEGKRTYLLAFQNLAEPRATGGLIGSFALLHVDNGTMTIEEANRASRALGSADPPLATIDPAVVDFYGRAMTIYPASANFSPDFPTGASSFAQMYRQRTGNDVDGVIATDPVALSYLMASIPPVDVGGGVTLNSTSVADFFLRDIYAKFAAELDPSVREDFTASATATVAAAVLGGAMQPSSMIDGLRRAVVERRILVWTARSDEQVTLSQSALGGAIPREDKNTTVGVYLNDGSGGKLGYYLHPEVAVFEGGCRGNGVREVLVVVTLANTSPATGLPAYVAGGSFGTPPYLLRTNVIVMAPEGGQLISAQRDGSSQAVAAGVDHGRKMSAVTVDLLPGENTTLTFVLATGGVWPPGTVVRPEVAVTPLRTAWKQSVESLSACQ